MANETPSVSAAAWKQNAAPPQVCDQSCGDDEGQERVRRMGSRLTAQEPDNAEKVSADEGKTIAGVATGPRSPMGLRRMRDGEEGLPARTGEQNDPPSSANALPGNRCPMRPARSVQGAPNISCAERRKAQHCNMGANNLATDTSPITPTDLQSLSAALREGTEGSRELSDRVLKEALGWENRGVDYYGHGYLSDMWFPPGESEPCEMFINRRPDPTRNLQDAAEALPKGFELQSVLRVFIAEKPHIKYSVTVVGAAGFLTVKGKAHTEALARCDAAVQALAMKVEG